MQHIHRVWNDDPRANATAVLSKWATGLGVDASEILKRAEEIERQVAA